MRKESELRRASSRSRARQRLTDHTLRNQCLQPIEQGFGSIAGRMQLCLQLWVLLQFEGYVADLVTEGENVSVRQRSMQDFILQIGTAGAIALPSSILLGANRDNYCWMGGSTGLSGFRMGRL